MAPEEIKRYLEYNEIFGAKFDPTTGMCSARGAGQGGEEEEDDGNW